MLFRSIALVLSVLLSPVAAVAQDVEKQVLVPIEIKDAKEFVRLVGEVTDQSVSQFIADLTIASESVKTVTVFIDSPGGDVIAGLRVIDAVVGLKVNKPGLTLRCYAHSAASMAFFILQTACDQRIVSEYSILMQHQASLGMRGKWGEVQSRSELVRQVMDLIEKKTANRLGISLPEYRARVVNDWWLVGRTAIHLRAADILGVISCSAELVKSGQCPLVYVPLSSEGGRSRGQSAPGGERSPSSPGGR